MFFLMKSKSSSLKLGLRYFSGSSNYGLPLPFSRFSYQQDLYLSNVQLTSIVQVLMNQVMLFNSTKTKPFSKQDWNDLGIFLALHLYVKLYAQIDGQRFIQVNAFLHRFPTYTAFLKLQSNVQQFVSDGQTRIRLLFSKEYVEFLDKIDLEVFGNRLSGIQMVLKRGNVFSVPYVPIHNSVKNFMYPIVGYRCVEKESFSLENKNSSIIARNNALDEQGIPEKLLENLSFVSILNCDVFTSLASINNKNKSFHLFNLLQYYYEFDNSNNVQILLKHSNELSYSNLTILNALAYDAWVFILEAPTKRPKSERPTVRDTDVSASPPVTPGTESSDDAVVDTANQFSQINSRLVTNFQNLVLALEQTILRLNLQYGLTQPILTTPT